MLAWCGARAKKPQAALDASQFCHTPVLQQRPQHHPLCHIGSAAVVTRAQSGVARSDCKPRYVCKNLHVHNMLHCGCLCSEPVTEDLPPHHTGPAGGIGPCESGGAARHTNSSSQQPRPTGISCQHKLTGVCSPGQQPSKACST
jgi:hypothetical protein